MKVAALTEAMMKTMLLAKLKPAATLVLAPLLLGVSLAAYHTRAAGTDETKEVITTPATGIAGAAAGPRYDGDKAGIRAAVAGLRAKGAHPLYAQELFTQVVIRELMAGPNRDSGKALELLHTLHELSLNFLSESGLTGLEVLARFDNEKLNPTTELLSQRLLCEHPAHPAALFFASQFLEKTGRPDAAFHWLMQLADSGFEDEELTVDACIRVADHLAHHDPKRARAYYWRAVQLAWATSPYGSPNAKVDRVITALNNLDRR